ncbi:HpcH/HpaI aldolase/citrate lyase family protein [Blastochloris viridis]|uniref:(3S)-malyl-CoA thioesterase n=1 Tax=Blastochloris viridis TaxID=1079 RepID=A0A0H5BKB3_BLAVI|nr:CoA ester lyase [Blastochloris viridis]ALK09047.1 (3S)-malyl-CoA thioesterase [Blastochloris viridis]BAS01092.1 hydroxymethylglutaryl-CoA lyase [Blastochloris viridis]CUU41709.1 (3S)-malyl-CoA thioesterase [Blastochloris viridis]
MRSLLFVPGDSPRKLAKALEAGADALILDLEDSVAPDGKAAARDATAGFLREAVPLPARPRLFVRVNALTSGLTDADLDAVIKTRPDGVMLPKAEHGRDVVHLAAKLAAREALADIPAGATGVLAIATETAASLFGLGSYAGCSPRLAGLAWGGEDLSADLGAETNHDEAGRWTSPYLLARNLCLAGAAAARVVAIDTVFVDVRDEAGLIAEAEAARRDGFSAKMAIHPGQVAPINAVFTPSAAAVAEAERVVAAFAAAGDAGVTTLDGKMLDRPHLLRARRVLERAGSKDTPAADGRG